jgi:hypothetical protein
MLPSAHLHREGNISIILSVLRCCLEEFNIKKSVRST